MKIQEQTCLADITNGTKVRLLKIDAGRGLKVRLAAMGLLAGAEFKVMNNGHPGPCVIDLKGSRMVLGRGMAGKIIVKSLES